LRNGQGGRGLRNGQGGRGVYEWSGRERIYRPWGCQIETLSGQVVKLVFFHEKGTLFPYLASITTFFGGYLVWQAVIPTLSVRFLNS
jgi:hypothetical protein